MLFRLSSFALLLLLVVIIGSAIVIGQVIGRRWRSRPDNDREHVSIVQGTLLGLVGLLWTMWAFASQLYDVAVAPLGRFLHQQVFTGSVITLDDEIADLEARLASGSLLPQREILAGIRLAEIYRERLFDKSRADALLDRLMVKYPDATELRVARRLPV